MSDLSKLNDQEIAGVSGGVSKDEALETALKHAGLMKDELDFLKEIKTDWEDGAKVYEICFYKGGFEYEYDIDVLSGTIVKFERDRD